MISVLWEPLVLYPIGTWPQSKLAVEVSSMVRLDLLYRTYDDSNVLLMRPPTELYKLVVPDDPAELYEPTAIGADHLCTTADLIERWLGWREMLNSTVRAVVVGSNSASSCIPTRSLLCQLARHFTELHQIDVLVERVDLECELGIAFAGRREVAVCLPIGFDRVSLDGELQSIPL